MPTANVNLVNLNNTNEDINSILLAAELQQADLLGATLGYGYFNSY